MGPPRTSMPHATPSEGGKVHHPAGTTQPHATLPHITDSVTPEAITASEAMPTCGCSGLEPQACLGSICSVVIRTSSLWVESEDCVISSLSSLSESKLPFSMAAKGALFGGS
ncbi:hypothetical protein E2C01_015030 [Portunus trituberculatus]|uniref:Uncharacterized protein n=1 Tax=Portunus trituberculatus TaxID=210409 RepID=A0A5B7DLG9_PORTR|nr:hypothetical protein [Portunus trituberculatus]